MAKRKPKEDDEVRYRRIDVWDHEGNVVACVWDASEADLDRIEEQYGDDPMFSVVIDN